MSYSMKENIIREYFKRLDLNANTLSVNTIKEDLKALIGEKPAIDVTYKKDVMLNEFTGKTKEFLNAEKLGIIFTDLDDKFKKIEFIINGGG